MASASTAGDQWPRYQYRATLVRIIDGDTAVLDVDLGLEVHARPRVRLAGYNAPEVTGPSKAAGQAARAALEGLLAGRQLLVRTLKDARSYERWLAEVYIDAGRDAPIDVAAAMKAAGHDVPRGR